MVKYACFTLATLVFLTYTDFIAAGSGAQSFSITVNDINYWYPNLIPDNTTGHDGDSSGFTWLRGHNLWDVAKSRLNQEQGVNLNLLTPSQVTAQITRIFSDVLESEASMFQRYAVMKSMAEVGKTLKDASDDTTAMSLLVNVDLLPVLMGDLVDLCL